MKGLMDSRGISKLIKLIHVVDAFRDFHRPFFRRAERHPLHYISTMRDRYTAFIVEFLIDRHGKDPASSCFKPGHT
jgi:hypothetical protein